MSAKTTESKASRQDHPSEPAPDIDNNLYDDSESQKKDYSNADFVPLIIVVFLIMISNSPCIFIECCKFCGDYLPYSPQICGE